MSDNLLNINEFLQKYPWPADLAVDPKQEVLWYFDLNIQPEQLWPYIVNTNQLDHDLGFQGIEYSEENGQIVGKTGSGDYFQSWIELPWEWNYSQWLSRMRYFTAGPFKYNRITGVIQRINNGQAIRLYIYIGSIGAHPFAEKIMAHFFDKFAERYREVFKRYEHEIQTGTTENQRVLTQAQRNKVTEYLKLFSGLKIDIELARRFLEYLLLENEIELYRIRIVFLAKKWGADLNSLLEICLHAVRLGLLLLTWDTICPHCRGPRSENPFLAEVPVYGRCDICQIEFESNTENSIEIVFHIHPSVREIKKVYYCSGEAHEKPHIKLQQSLRKKTEDITIDTIVPHGKYDYRVVGNPENSSFVQSASSQMKNHSDYWHFALKNPFEKDMLFVFENKTWEANYILRPAILFRNNLFHELFPDEALPLDLNLEIGKLNIMFIDISHSSEFYLQHGDVYAFKEVRKWFVYISEIVTKFGGVVFKTAGDGCFVSFSSLNDALDATYYLHQQTEKRKIDINLAFKISLNTGDCLAVNFNSKIDYFGKTINMVTKLQVEAEPGDIIISQNCLDEKDFKQHLDNLHIKYHPIIVRHRSLTAPLEAFILDFDSARK